METINVFEAAEVVKCCVFDTLPENSDQKSGIMAINEKGLTVSFNSLGRALASVGNTGLVFSWSVNDEGFIDLIQED